MIENRGCSGLVWMVYKENEDMLSVVRRCCLGKKAKASNFSPSFSTVHCYLDFLLYSLSNFAFPGVDIAAFEVALLNCTCLAFGPQHPSFLTGHTCREWLCWLCSRKQTELQFNKSNLLKKNLKHAWCLHARPSCSPRTGNAAIPGKCKIQPEFTRLNSESAPSPNDVWWWWRRAVVFVWLKNS